MDLSAPSIVPPSDQCSVQKAIVVHFLKTWKHFKKIDRSSFSVAGSITSGLPFLGILMLGHLWAAHFLWSVECMKYHSPVTPMMMMTACATRANLIWTVPFFTFLVGQLKFENESGQKSHSVKWLLAAAAISCRVFC